MAMNTTAISIVGCGPGSPLNVTDAARQAVAGADVLVGGKRLMQLFPHSAAERITVQTDIVTILQVIAARRAAGQTVAVAVSGDPGLYSLARNVIQCFGREECQVIPAVSSVQVAFARLGLDWAGARILSAHGRIPNITAHDLGREDKIAVLAGMAEAVRWLADTAAALQVSHTVFLGENLTLDSERFRQVAAEQLGTIDIASLSIVLFIRRSLLS